MSVVFGRGMKNKCRPLSFMAQRKRNVMVVKAKENCFFHGIVIAIANAENDPKYVAYGRGYRISPIVQKVVDKTGIDLSVSGSFPELIKFQEHFREYKITVYET